MKGSYIKINKYGNDEIKYIKETLYGISSYNNNYGEIVPYPIFREKDKYLCLPRFYTNNKIKINHKYNEGKSSKMKFLKELRPRQQLIVKECENSIKKQFGGIITLPCGYGKTVIALYLAAKLGVKTLVIVHKSFLQDQWVDRAKQFTDAKIGIIRRKKVEIDGKDIVIGMLQSISMINYDDNIFNQFGLVIYDEAHHIISEVFSNALFKICPKYTIGLTATPYRQGNLTKCLKLHLGDFIYKIDKKDDEHAIVKTFYYTIKHKKYMEKNMFAKGKTMPNIAKMINNICEIEQRNKILVDIIYTTWMTEDRKILVLSGRTTKIEHLKMLKEMLEKKIEEEVKIGNIENDECNLYYYTGKTSQLERAEAERHADIIFATYEMAHEGLDIERLNTVIMTTPKSSVQQAIGRIMRKAGKDITVIPLIIDIVDTISTFPNQYDKREKLYKKLKYDIEKYYIHSDKIISKGEHLKNIYGYTDDELKDEFDDDNPDYVPDIYKVLKTTED